MREMDWDGFAAAHHRAHLIVVDTGRAGSADGAAAHLIRRLIDSLAAAAGNFAVAMQETRLLVAVEEERDAARLRLALGAVPGEATDDWSSVAHVQFDKAAARRIGGSIP